MQFNETLIPGCYEIFPKVVEDVRGKFVKSFNANSFQDHGLETTFTESFYSVSRKNVLRGMHFQLPPQAHVKLVYCVAGDVLDVLVDLRVGSPVYGQAIKFNLSAANAKMLYIPIGVAHGFYTISDVATMIYMTSTVHAPQYDAGINWQSFAIWPTANPILSARDNQHPFLENFISPFEF